MNPNIPGTIVPISRLEEKARQIRKNSVALSIEYVNGHLASAFSIVDVLTALYYHVMNDDDQFILSKGHGVLSLYAVLRDKGYSPHISGHPDIDVANGIQCTTGSLGHGFGIAVGKGLARHIMRKRGKVYVVLGDGECQEGSVWEAFNIMRRYKLNNVVPIIDHNKLQALDSVENISDETNLAGKIAAFGLDVHEANGHDISSLLNVFSDIKVSDGPSCVIAHTVKGKGISFMENIPGWHVRQMNPHEIKQALEDLG